MDDNNPIAPSLWVQLVATKNGTVGNRGAVPSVRPSSGEADAARIQRQCSRLRIDRRKVRARCHFAHPGNDDPVSARLKRDPVRNVVAAKGEMPYLERL